MALCKLAVLKVYNSVIEDVISGVRDVFADEGLDEQVLQELKMLWESKLMASKAVENVHDVVTQAERPGKKVEMSSNGASSNKMAAMKQQQYVKSTAPNQTSATTSHQPPQQPHQPQYSTTHTQILGPSCIPGQPHTLTTTINTDDKMIPIQITLPAQPTVDSATRVLTIHVPASALNGPQLHTLLTGPVITATMGLPAQLASSLLQQHVNAALQQQNTHSGSGVHTRSVDGISDDDDEGSEDEDDRSDEEEDDDEDKDEDGEDAMDEQGNEEEPLNSEDDVTDEEPTDLFDTDNVVVCQYDKITRSRNKWKFYLKDGIMNLEGEDFLFQKANGDAEW